MPETKYEVKVFRVNYTCDKCGNAPICYTGTRLDSYPPWYVHRCPACKATRRCRKTYPRVEYLKVGEGKNTEAEESDEETNSTSASKAEGNKKKSSDVSQAKKVPDPGTVAPEEKKPKTSEA